MCFLTQRRPLHAYVLNSAPRNRCSLPASPRPLRCGLVRAWYLLHGVSMASSLTRGAWEWAVSASWLLSVHTKGLFECSVHFASLCAGSLLRLLCSLLRSCLLCRCMVYFKEAVP